MNLTKGMIIKQVKANTGKDFEGTIANGVLVYEVTRVNKKTYSLKCIEGYMKGTECKLIKGFKEYSVDIYGTSTTWEVVK